MLIITHRGIDSENTHSFTESSKEAFLHFLNAGYGIEFDIQLTKDGIPVISHDNSLKRLAGQSLPRISEMTEKEFLATPLPNGHTLTLDELTRMMQSAPTTPARLHALHLKHHNQTKSSLDILIPHLEKLTDVPLVVFDVLPEAARRLKREVPALRLAASVSHPHDITLYNSVVGHTLLSIEELLMHKDLYEWAWLDEWDRADEGSTKKLYDTDTVSTLRTQGFKLAVVSPELHATSPHLLGGESHEDAKDFESLKNRWQEILSLSPDALCTDYPRFIKTIL